MKRWNYFNGSMSLKEWAKERPSMHEWYKTSCYVTHYVVLVLAVGPDRAKKIHERMFVRENFKVGDQHVNCLFTGYAMVRYGTPLNHDDHLDRGNPGLQLDLQLFVSHYKQDHTFVPNLKVVEHLRKVFEKNRLVLTSQKHPHGTFIYSFILQDPVVGAEHIWLVEQHGKEGNLLTRYQSWIDEHTLFDCSQSIAELAGISAYCDLLQAIIDPRTDSSERDLACRSIFGRTYKLYDPSIKTDNCASMFGISLNFYYTYCRIPKIGSCLVK